MPKAESRIPNLKKFYFSFRNSEFRIRALISTILAQPNNLVKDQTPELKKLKS